MSDAPKTEAVYAPLLQPVLPLPWVQARLVALYPSKQIAQHCDAPIVGVRYHLPLQLNPACWVFHDGTWQQLEEGQLYQMDPTRPHGSVNWGSTLRVHLMVDLSSPL
jgi:capsular polysaccharide biosynthesis protein